VAIGQALAEARHRAGLTVTQVSERTRIRETIIRAIEDDDYSTCGGDFYARGNIRSIARAVGTDPEPLIREYDARHRAPGALSAVSLAELQATSERAPERRGPDLSAARGRVAAGQAAAAAPGRVAAGQAAAAAGAAARRWLSTAGDLAVVAATTVRLWLSRSAAGQRAASASSAARRHLNWVVVLGVALAVALGFGVYRFLASPQQTAVTPSAASGHAAAGHHATHARPNPAREAGQAAVAPSPAAAVPSPAAAPPAQRLAPVSVTAFGPGGGDNPQFAPQAVGGQPGSGWRTDWYSTARFGNLYPGTGLLLDMGRPVTLTAVQIALGRVRGASLQIRVGAARTLADLRSVAHAAGAGGVVRLRLTRPARGRFVLIWFTSLPPDPAGTFQVEVWNVRLDGRA
jgi:Helix-turn-helix domain